MARRRHPYKPGTEITQEMGDGTLRTKTLVERDCKPGNRLCYERWRADDGTEWVEREREPLPPRPRELAPLAKRLAKEWKKHGVVGVAHGYGETKPGSRRFSWTLYPQARDPKRTATLLPKTAGGFPVHVRGIARAQKRLPNPSSDYPLVPPALRHRIWRVWTNEGKGLQDPSEPFDQRIDAERYAAKRSEFRRGAHIVVIPEPHDPAMGNYSWAVIYKSGWLHDYASAAYQDAYVPRAQVELRRRVEREHRHKVKSSKKRDREARLGRRKNTLDPKKLK